MSEETLTEQIDAVAPNLVTFIAAAAGIASIIDTNTLAFAFAAAAGACAIISQVTCAIEGSSKVEKIYIASVFASAALAVTSLTIDNSPENFLATEEITTPALQNDH